MAPPASPWSPASRASARRRCCARSPGARTSGAGSRCSAARPSSSASFRSGSPSTPWTSGSKRSGPMTSTGWPGTAPAISARCSPRCARWPRSPSRPRRPSAFASITPCASWWSAWAPRSRWCWRSMTSTGPTARRSSSISYLLRRPPQGAVLLVCASRAGRLDPALSAAVDAAARTGPVEQIALTRLEPDDVGSDPPAHRRCRAPPPLRAERGQPVLPAAARADGRSIGHDRRGRAGPGGEGDRRRARLALARRTNARARGRGGGRSVRARRRDRDVRSRGRRWAARARRADRT